jgi:hypothetical protein
VLGLVTSAILDCICNIYDITKELWQSIIYLKVAGSLELFIIMLKKPHGAVSSLKGMVDISGTCLLATCCIKKDKIIDSRPIFTCQGFC